MKIHFCDLCNESVPQSELDAGRAFMRKGRVVCVKCDQLMTQREASAGAHLDSAAGVFGATSAASAPHQASLTPLPVAPASFDAGQAGLAPGGQVHHHPHLTHPRPQRSGSGVAVALFSMALTALAFYWLTERSDKISTDVDRKLEALSKSQLDSDMRSMQRSTEMEGRLLKLEENFKNSVENERKGIEARFVEVQSRLDKSLVPLNDTRADVATIKGVVPSVQRHEQELSAAAQKVTELETRAGALELALADVKKQLEQRPSPATAGGPGGVAAAPATPVGTPAWMGLVQQLESGNSGDRWVAVQTLGETRDPAVAEYLLPRLKDVDIFVRMATARVLGDLGSLKSTGALIEALNDQDSSVREAAYVSLCAVSKKSLPFDAHQEPAERAKRVKAWQDWWKKAQEEGAAQQVRHYKMPHSRRAFRIVAAPQILRYALHAVGAFSVPGVFAQCE